MFLKTPYISAILGSGVCFGFCFMLTACITGGEQLGRNGELILEKSRSETPNWIQIGPGNLQSISDVFHYVEIHSKGLDLPLALNHAQVNALAGSSTAVAAMLKEGIQKQVRASKKAYILTNSEQQTQLTQLILNAVNKVHGSYAKVADIYYEKLQTKQPVQSLDGQDAYSYDIYVLIKFPAYHLQEIYADLKKSIKSSKSTKLRELLDVFGEDVMAVSR